MAVHRLAVIGNPIAHSRSPEIHAAFAREFDIEIDYQKLLAPEDGFRRTALDFIAAGGIGFNVTVPFKFDACNLCDEVSDVARRSEAVNTVAVIDGRLYGYNTDGTGIRRDIEQNLGWTISGARVLVIGAGGAVSGILPALLDAAPGSIHIYNRTMARAHSLAARYGGPVEARDVEGLASDYDLVISGSSAGLAGGSVALPDRIVGPRTRCYDMIYSDATTMFNAWASAVGCLATSDGLGMLVEQAAEAFNIWFGLTPQTRTVIEQMRTVIRGKE